ncbi:MAG: hypothetical protein SF002_10310 [Alphaproteobacteria bacterium]|nr:hypothetical protein [Alphaproteobacteria bacterium]
MSVSCAVPVAVNDKELFCTSGPEPVPLIENEIAVPPNVLLLLVLKRDPSV